MNRHKKSRIIKYVILSGLCILFYVMGIRSVLQLKEDFHTVSIRLMKNPITLMSLKNIQEQEAKEETSHLKDVTAYSMEDHITIKQEEYDRTKDVTLYHVYGRMDQVLALKLHSGNYPYSDDTYGCIIDEDTAYELFGSTKVIGNEIVIKQKKPMSVLSSDNKNSAANAAGNGDGGQSASNMNQSKQQVEVNTRVIIRGVVESKQPLVMIHEMDSKAEFWNLELDYGKYQQGRTYAEQMIYTYGLSQDSVIVEQKFIADCVGNLLLFPVLIFAILILIKVIRQIRKIYLDRIDQLREKHTFDRRRKLRIFAGMIGFTIPQICIIAGLIVIIGLAGHFFGYLPIRYLPTKWSDFNQYIRYNKMIQDHLDAIDYVYATQRIVALKQYCQEVIFTTILCIFTIFHIKDLK